MSGFELPAPAMKALPEVIKAVRKLSEPATQDKLVAAIRRYPQIPKLSWRQRGSLTKVIGTEAAANALMDQDDAGSQVLATLIAQQVFKGRGDFERSRLIADALITEYPGCVDGAERAVGFAYQLREIRRMQSLHGEQLDGIGQTVTAVHAIVSSEVRVRLDPEVVLEGPLDALKLRDEYRRVLELQDADPSAAADRLALIINRIESAGNTRLARGFQEERADLLARAGRLQQAADAWLPMVDDYLTAGYGFGPHDAVNSWAAIATSHDAPTWLQVRRTVVISLEHWVLGDRPAGEVMQYALEAAAGGDPAAPTWLMHAAEACLADGQDVEVAKRRERLLGAAQIAEVLVAVRLNLAVADAAHDEQLWQQLLRTAVPGAAAMQSDLAALILARRARYLYRAGNFDEAQTQYRMAASRGGHAELWQDAASWMGAARHILQQAESVNYDELKEVSKREAAMDAAGPGSLLEQAYDPRATALTKLVEITTSDHHSARSTRVDLRRYLLKSAVLAELNEERDAHRLLGRLHRQIGQLEEALQHFIVSEDVDAAGEVASEMTTYYDCLAAAESPVAGCRTAALRAGARQADLIPDNRVEKWARVALGEAQQVWGRPFGPDPHFCGYEVLQGLAERLPEALVPTLLSIFDPLIPREYGRYRVIDDQLARILIGLARTQQTHRAEVAERIAAAFEHAEDLASIIVNAAPSLRETLRLITGRLVSLLDVGAGIRSPKTRYAALALVEIGDRCAELEVIVNDAVEMELAETPEDRRRRVGDAEETAILATSLPMERRLDLARAYCTRTGDPLLRESDRATYAQACRIVVDGLDGTSRNDLFDMLIGLHAQPQHEHPDDAMERNFQDPFGFLRVTTVPGRLRRQVAKTLAALAADDSRQRCVWMAAQQLAVSGEALDANTMGYVGYTIAKAGFATQMPWESLACSPEWEIRRLAAALVPLVTQPNQELVDRLAGDPRMYVRRELAQSIINMQQGFPQAAALQAARVRLESDASYGVRRVLKTAGDRQ